MRIEQVLPRLAKVSKSPTGWKACCPAHEDKSPSLSVAVGGDGRILLHCHAGCSVEAIATAIDFSVSDLFPDSVRRSTLDMALVRDKAKRTARYRSKKPMTQTSFHPYTRDGVLLSGVFRFDPSDGSDGKQYVPVHATAGGGAVGDPPKGWPLYRLPRLLESPGEPVFVVEGEKAADALAGLGLLVTTSAHGAKGWKKTDWTPLVGRSLVFMPDNDAPGLRYAEEVVAHVQALGGIETLERVDLSALPDKADAVDLIERLREQGLDDAQLVAAIESITEAWEPNPGEGSPEESLLGELEETYGSPFVVGAKGVPLSVNQQFVAGYCARKLQLLFDPAHDRFYEYDPRTGIWQRQTDAAVVQRVGATLGPLLEGIGAGNLRPKCTQSILAAITMLLKGMTEKREAWPQHDSMIHVANGMLRLAESGTPRLMPFSEDYYSRNRSRFVWDPTAEAPLFLTRLLEPALSREDILLLQKYAGQCLLGRNPSQTLLLIRGTAGGGKSTLCEVIESMVGEENIAQLRVEQLSSRFESLRFLGRTLLSGKDVAGNFLDSKSAYVLKALVGGDRLEGEVKGGNESFALRGDYNVIITSNSRLTVGLDGDTAAWRRRLLIIDFAQPPVEKRIPFFARKLLKEEGSGILRWMVEGAVLLQKDLETHGTIRLHPAQLRRIENLLAESDSIRSFVRDQVVKAEASSSLTVAELTEAYFDYCDQRGWTAYSRRRFETTLPEVMMEQLHASKRNDIQRDDKHQRGFSHVHLKDGRREVLGRDRSSGGESI